MGTCKIGVPYKNNSLHTQNHVREKTLEHSLLPNMLVVLCGKNPFNSGEHPSARSLKLNRHGLATSERTRTE